MFLSKVLILALPLGAMCTVDQTVTGKCLCEDDVCVIIPSSPASKALCLQGSNAETDHFFEANSYALLQGGDVKKCGSCEGLGYPTFSKNDPQYNTISLHSSEGVKPEDQCLSGGDYCIPGSTKCCHGECPGGWSSYCPHTVEHTEDQCIAAGEYCLPGSIECCHGECGWTLYCPQLVEHTEDECLDGGDYCIPGSTECCHGECPGGWSSYCPKR
jgi:hypothetical protein